MGSELTGSCNELRQTESYGRMTASIGPAVTAVRTATRTRRVARFHQEFLQIDMGRAGIEPATLGLKVPCSTD
jgi:hypothetical protein